MMTLSDLSIKRPVFAWILMFALIFFGVMSFRKMGINENPDIDFPTIRVSYIYDGASPEVIEKDVIEPVESVLVSLEGIHLLSSSAQRGSADISIEFELDRNIDFALQEVQTILGRAQRSLPETIEPPVVTKSNAADDPILFLTLLTKEDKDRSIMLLFRDRIKDKLSTIEGVSEIRAFGYHEPMLRIDLRAADLQRMQITAKDVIDSIQRESKELPAGKLEFKDDENSIRVMGEASKLEDFQNLVISRRGGSPNYIPLKLKDVANVYEGIENLRRVSRMNSNKALGIAVQKQRGVNAAATAQRVMDKLDSINKDLPDGTKLIVNLDRTIFIRESVNELVKTLFLSAILTSIVCWLFLGSLSATFNILLAIPTSIIGCFIIINWLGFTLNTFSLLGLTLAIGVVVDDAIIVLENIVRFMQKGLDRFNASLEGAREITFAVLATSLSLVSVFFPISFLKGLEGKFFFEFAITISVAVGLSALEALTLAPMRCSQFLDTKTHSTMIGFAFENMVTKIKGRYKSILFWSLERPLTVIAISFVIFALSLVSIKFLPLEFAPDQDRGFLFVSFQAPIGKTLSFTSNKLKEFEEIAKQHPAVERVFVAAGGMGQGGQSNKGTGFLVLKDRSKRKQNQFEIADELRKSLSGIKDLEIFIRDRTGGSFGGRRGNAVEFVIVGPDPDKQREFYFLLKKKMEDSNLIVGVNSEDALTFPEIHIVPNREKAIQSGVEISEIAEIINATVGGKVAAQYTSGSRRFNIMVQLQEKDRQLKEQLNNIYVRNNRGELLALNRVVDIVDTTGPQGIYREDRVRGMRVDANLAKGVRLGDALKIVNAAAKEILPEDYYLKFSETPEKKLGESVMIIVMGLLIAYMVLAIQFNSFLDPVVVFLAIPFGLSGSLIALLLGGQSLNIYSVIGILLTMGIVMKNSILLVEFANLLREKGTELKAALREAGPVRFRPILMTTASTVAAAIPPALAIGPGAETRIPMALTVIGGSLVSMTLTLVVVPCVYLLLKKNSKIARHKSQAENVEKFQKVVDLKKET